MRRDFSEGEVIFKEGDASLAVYLVVYGEVEILKERGQSSVTLAVMSKGDVFGEMGVIDRKPRSATARARSEVTLEITPRVEYLHELETRPGQALKLISTLVERLRTADDMLLDFRREQGAKVPSQSPSPSPSPSQALPVVAPSSTVAVPAVVPEPGGRPENLLLRLFRRHRKRREPTAAENQASRILERPGPLTVLVAAVFGDFEGGLVAKVIHAALDGIPAYSVRCMPNLAVLGDPSVQGIEDEAQRQTAAAFHGNRLLVKHRVDLLVWGELDSTGQQVVVRLLTPLGVEERPGSFVPELFLLLPVAMDEAWTGLLRGAVMAALSPRTEAHGHLIRLCLVDAIDRAVSLCETGRSGFSGGEQSAVLTAFANAAAAAGNLEPAGSWYATAIGSYRRAIRFLSGPVDSRWGPLHRLLGLTLQANGERTNDIEFFAQAAEAYRSALDTITRDFAPREWAALQNRLGVMLYRLDLKTGKLTPLKEALTAFQNALQVITRAEDPYRWAEIMNNLGQSLQIYGEHVRSADVLRRAVEACRHALEVRTREATPLLWAASQNNLGSASFMLARMTGDSEDIGTAVEGFRAALGVYSAHGLAKMAQVTEKNLAHAEKLGHTQSRRRVASVSWAEENKPADRNGRSARPPVSADPDDEFIPDG
ncbi:MAG: cyclic nucleotide-binding domain-containing protein [Alphaproteobacteria bacterium]